MTMQYIVHFLISDKPCDGYPDPSCATWCDSQCHQWFMWLSHCPLLKTCGEIRPGTITWKCLVFWTVPSSRVA